jgi:peptide/nickel transport system substrate-binding protein
MILPKGNLNFSEHDNPAVNRLIDQALTEPDPKRRAVLWEQIDERVMRDAPWVPLLRDKWSFFWSSRVRSGSSTPGPERPSSPLCGSTHRAL